MTQRSRENGEVARTANQLAQCLDMRFGHARAARREAHVRDAVWVDGLAREGSGGVDRGVVRSECGRCLGWDARGIYFRERQCACHFVRERDVARDDE